jgi:hypothetical protein
MVLLMLLENDRCSDGFKKPRRCTETETGSTLDDAGEACSVGLQTYVVARASTFIITQ